MGTIIYIFSLPIVHIVSRMPNRKGKDTKESISTFIKQFDKSPALLKFYIHSWEGIPKMCSSQMVMSDHHTISSAVYKNYTAVLGNDENFRHDVKLCPQKIMVLYGTIMWFRVSSSLNQTTANAHIELVEATRIH